MGLPKFKLVPITGASVIRNGKCAYRAIHSCKGEINLDELAQIISDKNAQSVADVYANIFALAQELKRWVGDGFRVNLGPLGTFSQTVKLNRLVRDAKEVKNGDVSFNGIEYHPEDSLKTYFSFLRYQRDYENEWLEPLSDDERRQQILKMLQTQVTLSMRSIRLANHASIPTTEADLEVLMAKGLVKKSLFNGRSIYTLADSVSPIK